MSVAVSRWKDADGWSHTSTTVLCDDGSIWRHDSDDDDWYRVGEVPQEPFDDEPPADHIAGQGNG